eukprot:GILI01007441.1.p1 GENE.GILI01007441.1~~GILI01007441.1.p1  ORF type:complete len:379 (-),score=105.65 GILI01007441.1:349-1485(-)
MLTGVTLSRIYETSLEKTLPRLFLLSSPSEAVHILQNLHHTLYEMKVAVDLNTGEDFEFSATMEQGKESVVVLIKIFALHRGCRILQISALKGSVQLFQKFSKLLLSPNAHSLQLSFLSSPISLTNVASASSTSPAHLSPANNKSFFPISRTPSSSSLINASSPSPSPISYQPGVMAVPLLIPSTTNSPAISRSGSSSLLFTPAVTSSKCSPTATVSNFPTISTSSSSSSSTPSSNALKDVPAVNGRRHALLVRILKGEMADRTKIYDSEFDRPPSDLEVGVKLDAKDPSFRWCPASVVRVGEGQVLLHFDGWPVKFDTWVDLDSDHIAPLNAFSAKEGAASASSSSGSSSSSSTFSSIMSSFSFSGGAKGFSIGNFM